MLTTNRRLDKERKGIGSTSTICHRMTKKDLYDWVTSLLSLTSHHSPVDFTHFISAMLSCRISLSTPNSTLCPLLLAPLSRSILSLSSSFLPTSVSSPIPCGSSVFLSSPPPSTTASCTFLSRDSQCNVLSPAVYLPVPSTRLKMPSAKSWVLFPPQSLLSTPAFHWLVFKNYIIIKALCTSLHFCQKPSNEPLESGYAWVYLSCKKIVGIKYMMTVASKL